MNEIEMKTKQKRYSLCTFGWLVLVVFVFSICTTAAYAQSVGSLETDGNVTFNEPIGKPEPVPPDGGPELESIKPPLGGTQKPGGNLPQLNDTL